MPRFPQPKQFVTDEIELNIRSVHRVTPSNMDPWFGGWAPGARFTAQQHREMAAREIDPDTVDTLEVHVQARQEELYVRYGYARPYRRIVCPVIGARAGKKLVISPRGHRKLVFPDGSLRPSKGAKPMPLMLEGPANG